MSFADSLKNSEDTTEVTLSASSLSTSTTLNANENISVYGLNDETLEENWVKPVNANLYEYYDNEYNDGNISTIDENKNITLDNKQINLTQENNSQYIPFQMSRYYDGFDLSTTKISIYWINQTNAGSIAKVVDVYHTENKIRFAWLVDDNVTALAGKVEFEIHAEGINSKGHPYLWKTKPNNTLNVIQALQIKTFIAPDDTWQTDFISEITNLKNQAVVAAQNAEYIYNNLQDGIEQEVANAMGDNYYTKTETSSAINDSINNLKSDISNTYAKKSDIPTVPQNISAFTNDVGYLTSHQDLSDYATKDDVQTAINNADISSKLNDYYTKSESDEKYALKTEIPIIPENVSEFINDSGYLTSDDVSGFALKSEIPSIEGLATETYVQDEIAKVDVSDQLDNYYTKDETYNKEEIDTAISNVEVDLSGYYSKSEIDNKEHALSSSIETNSTNISSLSTTVSNLQTTVDNIDTSPRLTYDVKYNDTEDTDVGENVFVLYEIENEGQENEIKSEKTKFTIVGGSGGGTTSSTLKIEYITKTPLVVTLNDKAVISYNFSGTDSSGDAVLEGDATWKVGSTIVATNTITAGENSFDITDYLNIGTQKVTLSVVDNAGSLVTKTWTVQKIDVRLESTFNDQLTYPIGTVSFDYTPYGAVSKDVHFVLNGVEIGRVTTSSSGIPMSYTLPSQTHGSNLLDVYITAEINNNIIESNHITKDILWYDESSDIPVIGCVQQKFTAKQYDTTNIVYTVYDPTTESPEVVLSVDGEPVSTLVLDSNTQTWQYKTSDIGEHTLTITCGVTVKTLKVTVEKLDIDVEPVTANLAFDFNPVGKSNNDTDRLWTDGTTSMTVSNNFDWTNGGYQIDENGDQYFCVKAGTSATIDYNLFADDARKNGKEFKIIFKTENVRKSNAKFLGCTANSIGLEMNVHEAYVHSSADSLYVPYSEEDIIELDINIFKDTEIPLVLSYEDGSPGRPMIYTSDHSFTQSDAVPIVIGSADCDVLIYRMKAYSSSLSDSGILSNFIADARNATEMIARYNRNQIYDENNQLTPESVANACPKLKVIKIECPHFTNDKKDFVKNTTIECIHKGGDPILDNWKAVNCYHSGQGTTSNEYGHAGRNMDLLMCFDGNYTNSKIVYDENYKTILTMGDGSITDDGTGKITLTRNSVPTNYLNIKVNIASSENENNALLQKRFNDYLPYTSVAKKKNSNVKNTMEFVNCVVFIKENDEDLSTHREFQDTDWHFYAIGNVGDSKKTDYTRVTDPTDPKEFVVEIMDNTLPNSTFSGSEEALSALDADQFDEDGTYGFRYEMDGITDEQHEANMQTWRDFYRFVALSTEEEFKAGLKNWFIVDSALYFYLFTERYTMIDNRAKNTFWHWSKVYISQEEADALGEDAKYYTIDDEAAAINSGYRYDFWNYDNDTSSGINNSGELTMTYGKEDTDYRTDGDASSGYIFNAAESAFFCKIRDNMRNELSAMFVERESQNCWSAEGLIVQFDNAQNEFPEELWRLDYIRKYRRTYEGGTSRFLVSMMNGKKKYQRRQFERDQEKYMATKYFGTTATSDQIMFRCNTPIDAVVAPDYTLHLTPYSNMYLSVMFGATYRTQIRAKAGVQYDIECPFSTMDDTAVLIYCASRIQSMGDISACYIHDNDFSKAIKLQELIIGNSTEGYQNAFLEKLSISNTTPLTLLEKLDIQNTPNLKQAIDLSRCTNLTEFYAKGSGITGITFANGGRIQIAELPAITSMTLRELLYLNNLDVISFDNLATLIVENCSSVDAKNIFEQAPNINRVRIIGIDWNLENTDLLNNIYSMFGIDKNGYNLDRAVLTGKVHVPVIRERELYLYNEAWNDLEITYDSIIEQYAVTFVNTDGSILDVQYVDKGDKPVDPTTRADDPINIPTQESTVQYDYSFSGWDSNFIAVFENLTYTAVYLETIRNYTVKYISKNTVLQETNAPYGTSVFYKGDIPTYVGEEAAYKYYLFKEWDKSGFVDGDKIINAVYDICSYTSGYFDEKDLSTMTPVEIYALTKLGLESSVVESMDDFTFNMGRDYNYSDIESNMFISEKTIFTGSNYIDTGISVMDIDRDFVFAIDYEFSEGNSSNATLMQCYKSDGSDGFKLLYNSNPQIKWGTNSNQCAKGTNREMLVLRHVKGENGLHVYTSNLTGNEISYTNLDRTKSTITNSTLVFGCTKADDGAYENYAKGTIYWAKLWFADLGDEACKDLVAYTHEEINVQMCGFKRKYLSDNSGKRSSMSFLCSHILRNKKAINSTYSNEGGWATSTLNTWLNNRFYNGLPLQIKQLVKQVKVQSSIGNQSNELSTSNCYIYIPALIELNPSTTEEPYINEDSTIEYIVNNSDRIRKDHTGTAVEYWTRSPNVGYTSYFYYIQGVNGTSGSVNGFGQPPSEYGVVFEFSI